MTSVSQDFSDLALKIANLLDSKYTGYLGDRFFTVLFDHQKDVASVTVTLATADQSFYYPIDGRIELNEFNLSAEEGLIILSDYIDSYLETYFQSGGEVFLPIDWADYEHNNIKIYLRGQIFNKKLENLADQILAAADKKTFDS